MEVAARLRVPIPSGVAQAYVDAYTQPGDVVLVPYCQGVSEVSEIAARGRRALACNFDPLMVLIVRAGLVPVPVREIDAAVARLGDSLKQGVPLRRTLAELYATTCPACQRPAVADYYLWDRDAGVPIAKQLRCSACSWDGQAAADQEDRERLAEVPARGMHYYYVLDRVAPQSSDTALRSRLESLLKLYSPRNLYALAELTLKMESLFPPGPLHEALKVLLLDCLERCSSLTPLPGAASHRRGLTLPARYVEYNVWNALEEAAVRALPRQRVFGSADGAGLAPSLEAFQAGGATSAWAGLVSQEMVRDLRRSLAPRSLRLILFSPPPLDAAIWSLSYLWGAWLLGSEAVSPLRALLRLRAPDPAWYAKVMSSSLHILADLLRDDGRLVLVLTGQRPGVVEALMLAASSSRLGLSSLVQGGADYRLELSPTLSSESPAAEPASTAGIPGREWSHPAARRPPLEEQVRQFALEAAIDIIRARGEPATWLALHAAIQRRLADAGLLARVQEAEEKVPSPLALVAEQVRCALEDPALVRLTGAANGEDAEALWWLADAANVAPALCDRVETASHHELSMSAGLTEAEFGLAIYERFPGLLTPDASLIATCLHAYGAESPAGVWHLRPEDLLVARQAEQKRMVRNLQALGRRLGYKAAEWPPFDLAWSGAGQVRAAFAVRAQAILGAVLSLSDRAPGIRPYLVIPGGRSALVSYKLAHNPPWQQIVDEAGWRFIKYRHVRELLAQPEVDEYALRTIVGLDPMVERESVQLPLF